MNWVLTGASTLGGQAFSETFLALYRAPRAQPQVVDVPEARFLMIDGVGDPNTARAYGEAVEALYTLSYTLKFMLKKELGLVYRVMALEGLWWAEDMSAFMMARRDDWHWTMMIAQPNAVTPAMLEAAREQVLAKKKVVPALGQARLEAFHEGRAAQILHIGPYSEEGTTIARLHAFIQEREYALSGKHHEIYIGDPRRAAPEKLRTILRQPMVSNG